MRKVRGTPTTEAHPPSVYCIVLLLKTLPSDEDTTMSSVSEVNVDIRDFLMSINLEQYLLNFREFGFNNVRDCAEINDSVLLKVGISPTGHRRRILKQLQIILSKMQDIPIYANIHKTKKNDETSKDHQAPSSAQNTSLEFSDSHGVQIPSRIQLETVTKNVGENEVCVENIQSLAQVLLAILVDNKHFQSLFCKQVGKVRSGSACTNNNNVIISHIKSPCFSCFEFPSCIISFQAKGTTLPFL